MMLNLIKRQRLEAVSALLLGQMVFLRTIVKCIQRYPLLAGGTFRALAFFAMLVDPFGRNSFTALLTLQLGLRTVVKCICWYSGLAGRAFRKLAFFGMLVDSVERKLFTALLAFVLA